MKIPEILRVTEANNDNPFSFLRDTIFRSVQQLMHNSITCVSELFHYHRECLAFVRRKNTFYIFCNKESRLSLFQYLYHLEEKHSSFILISKSRRVLCRDRERLTREATNKHIKLWHLFNLYITNILYHTFMGEVVVVYLCTIFIVVNGIDYLKGILLVLFSEIRKPSDDT